MPTGTLTKSGILLMIAAAVLEPLLAHFGLPATCPVDAPTCLTASSLATILLTAGIGGVGAIIAWLGKNRGLTREALLKQALADLIGHAAATAVQHGTPLEVASGAVAAGPAPVSGGSASPP